MNKIKGNYGCIDSEDCAWRVLLSMEAGNIEIIKEKGNRSILVWQGEVCYSLG